MPRPNTQRVEKELLGNYYVEGLTGDEFFIRQIYLHQTMVSDGQGNDAVGTVQTFTDKGEHVTGPNSEGKYLISGTEIVLTKMEARK